jgi:urease accessory protein
MIWLLALAVAALAAPADAHGTLPGGGGFYAGALHPFLAWEHFLLLLALGALLGRQPHRPGQAALIGLAVALGTGLALGGAGVALPAGSGILAAAALTGAALAAGLPVPGPALALLAAGCGLAIGVDSGVPQPAGAAAATVYAPYAGVFVGVFLIALNAMTLASVACRSPYTIAVRVAGSWITAAAVMVLALHFRAGAA